MTMGAKQHPAERLVEWAAPTVLAAAAGWAAWKLIGLPVTAAGAGAFALIIGLGAMRIFGGAGNLAVEAEFEPLPFEDTPSDDELLLDDPPIGIEPDSRVVRLFERDEATPGEMVARIADYLSDGNRAPPTRTEEGSAAPPDASAALHAALANIRASLR